jgi:hypothetical protein
MDSRAPIDMSDYRAARRVRQAASNLKDQCRTELNALHGVAPK